MLIDVIMMVAGFGFSLALIPAIKKPPAWQASLLTGALLSVFAVCYYILELYLALFSTTITIMMWLVLLVRGLSGHSS